MEKIFLLDPQSELPKIATQTVFLRNIIPIIRAPSQPLENDIEAYPDIDTITKNCTELFDDYSAGDDIKIFAETKLAELETLLGHDDPVTQVFAYHDGTSYPRAYYTFPKIYPATSANSQSYIISPIGYDGTYFIPDNAILIEGQETELLISKIKTDALLAGFLNNNHHQEGTSLPDDYDPDNSITITLNKTEQHITIMAPVTAPAKDAYNRFITPRDRYSEDQQAAIKIKLTRILLASSNHDEQISVLLLPDSTGFVVHSDSIGAWKNIPSRHLRVQNGNIIIGGNPETETGHELQKLMDDKSHSIQAFENGFFLHPDLGAPGIVYFNDRPYFVYRLNSHGSAPEQSTFPEGMQPVDLREWHWLIHNKRDRLSGISPPPLPDELSHIEPTANATPEYATPKPPAY